MQIFLLNKRKLTCTHEVTTAHDNPNNATLDSWSANISELDIFPVQETRVSKKCADKLANHINVEIQQQCTETQSETDGGSSISTVEYFKLLASLMQDKSNPNSPKDFVHLELEKFSDENCLVYDMWKLLLNLVPNFQVDLRIQPVGSSENLNANALMGTFTVDKSSIRCDSSNFVLSDDIKQWWCNGQQQKDLIWTIILTLPKHCKFVKQAADLETPSDVFEKLMEDKKHFDFAVVGSDGKAIPCHKSFLAVQSTELEAMMKRAENNQLCFSEMTEDSLKAFVKYLYFCDIQIPTENAEIALDLLKAGHKYVIGGLEAKMRDLLLTMENHRIGLGVAIKLFRYARLMGHAQPLMEKAVLVLKEDHRQLSEEPEYKQVFVEDAECAMAMMSMSLGV